MTIREAEQIVAVLEAAYPNHPTKPETATAYWMALDDVPYPLVQEAAKRLLRQSRFFPAPSELRAVVAERLMGLPSGADAWAEVRRGFKDGGIYRRGGWSCEAVQLAVDAIGWRNLCLSREDSTYERDAFLRAYEGYRDRAMQTADLAELAAGQEAEALPAGIREIARGAD